MAPGNLHPDPFDAPADAGGGEVVERFRPTSGRLTGALGLVVAGTVLLVGVVERDQGFPLWLMAVAVLAAVLVWTSMLRPALWATREHLVMRNMLETVTIPLAAVESYQVRQVLVVLAGDRRHVSTVLGRSWRKVALGNRRVRPGSDGSLPAELPYVDWAQERLGQLVDDARAAAGVRVGSPEQVALGAAVRRERAWLPIATLVVSVAALVVTVLV